MPDAGCKFFKKQTAKINYFQKKVQIVVNKSKAAPVFEARFEFMKKCANLRAESSGCRKMNYDLENFVEISQLNPAECSALQKILEQKEKIGDMIITVEIKIPYILSKEEISLYQKLKDISSSNIRDTYYDR